jgi:hypothetical protein
MLVVAAVVEMILELDHLVELEVVLLELNQEYLLLVVMGLQTLVVAVVVEVLDIMLEATVVPVS